MVFTLVYLIWIHIVVFLSIFWSILLVLVLIRWIGMLLLLHTIFSLCRVLLLWGCWHNACILLIILGLDCFRIRIYLLIRLLSRYLLVFLLFFGMLSFCNQVIVLLCLRLAILILGLDIFLMDLVRLGLLVRILCYAMVFISCIVFIAMGCLVFFKFDILHISLLGALLPTFL